MLGVEILTLSVPTWLVSGVWLDPSASITQIEQNSPQRVKAI